MEKQSKTDKIATFLTVVTAGCLAACFTGGIASFLHWPVIPIAILTVIIVVLYYYDNIDK